MNKLHYAVQEGSQPRWADQSGSKIDLWVYFPHLDATLRYTSARVDPDWPHSEEIFERAKRGDFGPIQPYQPPVVPPKTKLFKADVWRRCTDSEAALLDAALSAQPVRLRRMWNDAAFISTSDALYDTLKSGISSIVGAKRAGELLEPTE